MALNSRFLESEIATYFILFFTILNKYNTKTIQTNTKQNTFTKVPTMLRAIFLIY